jgi:hypothetical protein
MERLRGQRRGAKKIPSDHLYSSTLIRGTVKNQNPKRVCGRPVTSRIAPTASRSVSSADPHSWYHRVAYRGDNQSCRILYPINGLHALNVVG